MNRQVSFFKEKKKDIYCKKKRELKGKPGNPEETFRQAQNQKIKEKKR